MPVMRRLFGLLCGASGGTGLLLCIAGIVGCWWLHAEVVQRVDGVFGRAETLLVDVGASLDQVGGRMRQTQSELESVRQREVDLDAKPPVERSLRRSLSRKGIAALSPQLGDARGKLNKATEIGLVVNGLLEALAELPLVERAGVDTDKLKETSAQLSALIDQTDKLRLQLGISLPEQPAETITAESSRAVDLVGQIVAATDDGSDRVNGARLKVADRHAQIIKWITLSAVFLTLLLVWIAAGQFSLLLHGRSLVRSR
jgi:hypothetical protein